MRELNLPVREQGRTADRRSVACRLLVLLVTVVGLTGCVAIAERVASHLAANDLKSLEGDLTVFEADLALFRECLRERGGSCTGETSTALAHSSQAAAGHPSEPIRLGASATLSNSMTALPAGHPARSAYETLTHPVAQQAAAVHDHLRGHKVAGTEGVMVSTARATDGSSESTVALDLKIDKLRGFHSGLMKSTGSRQWQALDNHCRTELSKAPEAADSGQLTAACRRIAFIRGYFEAYFRRGQFVKVDLELAGAISEIDRVAKEIEAKIEGLESQLALIEQKVAADAAGVVSGLKQDAAALEQVVTSLEANTAKAISDRFGSDVASLFTNLGDSATQLVAKVDQLAETQATAEVTKLAGEAKELLEKLRSDLEKIAQKVAGLDQEVIADIQKELSKADAELSNVFRVSNVGFVSRDATFQARLPSLEITLDPTTSSLVTVTDLDSGQPITSQTDLGQLGVVTDTSGVGTGASIGAEIVRVFFEALFDAQEGLPAVAPANAPDLRPTGLGLGDYSLPLFQSPMGHVDSADLTKMTELNQRIATQTRVLLTRVIEGIGPFSLNNESLESLIVEVVATSVRKAAAKATWCWYSCDLDTVLAKVESDARTTASDAMTAEEARLQKLADGEAERIRLKLGLSR